MNLPKKSVTAFIVLTIAIFLPSFTKADENKVLCFVAHKTSHGFGKHEYFAGCHLMGDWLAETYPGKIESRYSIGWPTDEDKFFKGADSVIFFCTGGGRHLVLGHEEKFDKLMRTMYYEQIIILQTINFEGRGVATSLMGQVFFLSFYFKV